MAETPTPMFVPSPSFRTCVIGLFALTLVAYIPVCGAAAVPHALEIGGRIDAAGPALLRDLATALESLGRSGEAARVKRD